jgi:serine/threonine-protein kinase
LKKKSILNRAGKIPFLRGGFDLAKVLVQKADDERRPPLGGSKGRKMKTSGLILALGLTMGAGAAQADLFAAIAFSPSSGQAGSAWNYDTATLAETEAYLQCGSEDCYTAVIFNQCGAIAVGDGYGMGFGQDLSSATAQDLALGSCEQFTTNCQITAAFCNEGY